MAARSTCRVPRPGPGGSGSARPRKAHSRRPRRRYTANNIQDCEYWARRFNRAVGEVVEEMVIEDGREMRRWRLPTASGKDIISLVSTPRVVRSKGRPGDILIIDEAAFCDDLDELLKAAMAVTTWGGLVRIISTHNGDDSPFNALVGDIRAGRLPYALHRITLDDAIGEGYARRLCTVRGDVWTADYAERWRAEELAKYRAREDADEELLCVPKRSGGAYFARALVESCLHDAPVLRYYGTKEFNAATEPERRAEMADWIEEHAQPLLAPLDRTRRHVIGGDFARSGDMSSYLPLQIGGTLKPDFDTT